MTSDSPLTSTSAPPAPRPTAQDATVLVLEGVRGAAVDWLAERYPVAILERLDEFQGDATAVRALVVRNRTRVDAQLLAQLPALEIVARAGVGLDNLDLDALAQREILVTYAPDAATSSVAELTLALALCVAHRVAELDKLVRAGGWDRLPGGELSGGTWGVVGLGRIGRTVAQLARGIGMNVIASDPAIAPGDDHDVRLVSLDELLSESLVISIHVPLAPETTHLLGPAELEAMRQDAILVNVARGGVVDEEALLQALVEGQIRGAGLDVRVEEPPASDDPFASLPNVVLTPHVGAFTDESQDRVLRTIAEDIDAVLSGDAPRNVVPFSRP